MRILLTGFSISFLALSALSAQARDHVEIVGSSTVFPFTSKVIADFTTVTPFKVSARSTGTGGGIASFCQGLGDRTPDIAGASRPMKAEERQACKGNGVTRVMEVTIGRDGIVLANTRQGKQFNFSRRDLYLALAEQVPDGDALVPNPYRRWESIDAFLPARGITVLGPPTTSGTRDTFQSLALSGGCMEFDAIKALQPKEQTAACRTMRSDGPFVEMSEDDNETLHRLRENPEAFGIFGFSYAFGNSDIEANAIDGVKPTIESITDGSYPLSRPLFLYVKLDHYSNVKGLQAFIEHYVSDAAIGEDGYLVDDGLVPLSEDERVAVQETVRRATPMGL